MSKKTDKKSQEKMVKDIRKMGRLEDNRKCADCAELVSGARPPLALRLVPLRHHARPYHFALRRQRTCLAVCVGHTHTHPCVMLSVQYTLAHTPVRRLKCRLGPRSSCFFFFPT